MTDVAIESGREQHGLITASAAAKNPFHLRGEPVVGHAVGFVEYHHFDTRHVDLVGLQQVDEAQRCGHHDLDAFLQLVDLVMTTGSAVHRENATTRMTRHRFDDLGHLNGEFAGGHEHQTEWTQWFGTLGDARQHRHAERERLTRTGLGSTAHVVPLEGDRDGFFLNGERLGETGRRQAGVDLVWNAEIGEAGGSGHRGQNVDGGEGLRGRRCGTVV